MYTKLCLRLIMPMMKTSMPIESKIRRELKRTSGRYRSSPFFTSCRYEQ